MILSPGTYAILNADFSFHEIRTFSTPTVARDGFTRPVVMTAQPAFDAATQYVIQNGWTIDATDARPVWQIVARSVAQISDQNWREADIATRAVAATATEEINDLRQWLTDFKTQVEASSSLADLKTRVAALPTTPQRTLVQVRTAIANKIDTGTVD